jgi:hypothetical protein
MDSASYRITTFVVEFSVKGNIMGMPVRIDDALYESAKTEAKAEHRTFAGQIEFWATVGRTALDNPDLPVSFIAESLVSMAEPRSLATPFVPRPRKG